jgi:hypothetical protein
MKGDSMNSSDTRPWHREPWPWILMAGPFVVVVAGLVTAWIAVKTSDGLVTEDYYKKGLVISQTLLRSDVAMKEGLAAGVRIAGDTLAVRLQAEDKGFTLPPTLQATISHPTRAGLDQSVLLTRVGGIYTGMVRLPAAGHWLVLLEDEAKTWRLLGNVILPTNGETLIGAPAARREAVSGTALKEPGQ